MHKTTGALLGVIVVVGLGTGILIQKQVNNAKHLTSVVVAVRSVPSFTKITRSDIRIEKRSLINVGTSPLTKASQVVGHYTATGLVPDEMVFPDTLSKESALLSLSDGFVGVSIPLNTTDFSTQQLQPGMYVDLIGVTQGSNGMNTTGMLASKVKILQVSAQSSNAPNKIVVAVPTSEAVSASQAALSGNLRVDVVPHQQK